MCVTHAGHETPPTKKRTPQAQVEQSPSSGGFKGFRFLPSEGMSAASDLGTEVSLSFPNRKDLKSRMVLVDILCRASLVVTDHCGFSWNLLLT